MMWISLICIAPAFPVRAEQAPEAMIRETGVSYETVEEALEDAQTAQIVVLTEDAQISGQVSVKEGVTLALPAEGKGYVGQYNPSNPEALPHRYWSIPLPFRLTPALRWTEHFW